MSPRLLIHWRPPPQPPSPLVSLLSQNTISFKCFKTQWFWLCNIWQLLPRFSIPNDTFSNYLLHSLNFIYFGYVSKTLFKIPHLLDFQKFPNPPNYWDSRLFDTWEHVRLKKLSISATLLAEIEWSLGLADITGTQKCKEFIWYVFVILDWEMSVSRPRPTRNKFE